MIEMIPISKKLEDYASYEAFQQKYLAAAARSYHEYQQGGHAWCWCLAGNIKAQHIYGEQHEIRYGTKQFSRGTRVYLAPVQWGDGYERVAVIGLPRTGRHYIEVVTRSVYIEHFRLQRVFRPAVLERMCGSKFRWWGDTEADRNEITAYLEHLVHDETDNRKF